VLLIRPTPRTGHRNSLPLLLVAVFHIKTSHDLAASNHAASFGTTACIRKCRNWPAKKSNQSPANNLTHLKHRYCDRSSAGQDDHTASTLTTSNIMCLHSGVLAILCSGGSRLLNRCLPANPTNQPALYTQGVPCNCCCCDTLQSCAAGQHLQFHPLPSTAVTKHHCSPSPACSHSRPPEPT